MTFLGLFVFTGSIYKFILNQKINYIDQMLDDSLYLNKAITCIVHRK